MNQPVERTNAQRQADELGERANGLLKEGRWFDALPLCLRAVELDPESAVHQHNLGVLLTSMGHVAEGEAAERRAVALAPENPRMAHSLGHNLLAQGRFAEAWPFYAARTLLPELNTGIPVDFPFPRWRGEPLSGKRLVIFPEQGFGDQLQFVRFLPQVLALGGQTTLLTFPALVTLFEHVFPGLEIIAASGAVEFPDPDYWTTLYDLPAIFGAKVDALPKVPYLRAPSTRPSLGKGFKVGLKLKGNALYGNDALRSLPDAEIARLREELPGTVISLEPDDSGVKNFADTATIIDQVDLVVSRDTSVAHLAGAMGKPCFLLVPGFSPDWRWMWGRTDSPWYPNHRLYRGGADGSWVGAVGRLIADANNAASPTRIHTREAIALRDQGRFSEALTAGRKAVAADQRNTIALHNLARLLTDLGRLKEGEAVQRRALAVKPEAPALRFGLAVNLLGQGRYREAWPFYEARAELPALDIGFPQGVAFPRWRGEDIADRRIAIMPEQGFGDHIQFARFLPWLSTRCREIILLAPPALVDLFRTAFPEIDVVAAAGTASFPKCDIWTTLSDLPALADISIENLPEAAYLPAGDAPRTGELRVGLMTKGNPAYLHDAHRTLPPETAAALRAGLPGTIVELDPAISGARSFTETARMIEGLDIVVSVDTAVGHLAGAMGKPCLLLVSGFATDWRWLKAGEESPWYPRHRLFRSEIDGDWSNATARLTAHLRMVATSR